MAPLVVSVLASRPRPSFRRRSSKSVATRASPSDLKALRRFADFAGFIASRYVTARSARPDLMSSRIHSRPCFGGAASKRRTALRNCALVWRSFESAIEASHSSCRAVSASSRSVTASSRERRSSCIRRCCSSSDFSASVARSRNRSSAAISSPDASGSPRTRRSSAASRSASAAVFAASARAASSSAIVGRKMSRTRVTRSPSTRPLANNHPTKPATASKFATASTSTSLRSVFIGDLRRRFLVDR